MRKISILGPILIITAGYLLFDTLNEQWTLNPKESLAPHESQFFQDFESYISRLKQEKDLPAQFASLQYVKYRFHSKLAFEHVSKHHLPVKTSPRGKNILEVDFIARPDSPNDHFIMQMSLVEIESGNKTWENSENFKLPNTNATK